jgi:alkylation response protein AidB-like acyl-CoA dehydrogenase
LGGDEDGGAVLARLNALGAAARALQMAGAARRVLEITVHYVSNRRQFGRAVGSFQAIQHKLADMALMLQGARHTAYRAAWELSEGRPAARETAIAKIAMNEALSRICSMAHQAHGAIGFTWEYDLHLYTRRAIAWRAEFGDTPSHRETLAAEMGL